MPLSGGFQVSLVTWIVLAFHSLPHVEGRLHIPLPTSHRQLVGNDHLIVVPCLAVLNHQHHLCSRRFGFFPQSLVVFTIRNDCHHDEDTT